MSKKLFYMVLGGFIFTTISVLAYTLASGEVLYETTDEVVDSNSNGYIDVKDALDELYSRTTTLQSEKEALQQQLENAVSQEDLEAAQAACPSGKDCVKKVETDTDTPTEYDINGEKFIVIWSNQYETALISKYNLLVGNQCTSSSSCTALASPTRKQDSTAIGYTGSYPAKGVLAFSSTNYWYDESALKADYTANGASLSGNPYPYVYNSQSNLYTYLNNYKTNLNSSKVKLVRLATYEELKNLGCTDSDTCPSWIKNTTFWTGSARYSSAVWALCANYGGLCSTTNSISIYEGVRPVIVVSTSEL